MAQSANHTTRNAPPPKVQRNCSRKKGEFAKRSQLVRCKQKGYRSPAVKTPCKPQQKAVNNCPPNPFDAPTKPFFQPTGTENFTDRRTAVENRSPTQLGRFRTAGSSPVAVPRAKEPFLLPVYRIHQKDDFGIAVKIVHNTHLALSRGWSAMLALRPRLRNGNAPDF
jgi:hypothetical protein